MYIRTAQEKARSKKNKRIRFFIIILTALIISFELGAYIQGYDDGCILHYAGE